ncbi:MAG: hypothetical protein N5P05_003613 [Chroococcopsis gigantea SAG 12.99]|jgi:uncharacterized lipoprotein YddW (UPF0748 family)|nr:hypothetical protein [Chroococcopsis gigantea SAG 12.99]
MRIPLLSRLQNILFAPPEDERHLDFSIRGIWIANRPHSGVLSSPDFIYQSLEFLKTTGFNTVFPVVWNRDHTLFPSQLLREYNFPSIDPFYVENNFDPLEILVRAGRELGLKIIPWFEYGFAAYPVKNGGHILSKKPHWCALDRNGNEVNSGGLTWMNGLDEEVQELILGLILEVVKNYDVDGIQGCDRLPAMPIAAGYNQAVIKQYEKDLQTGKIPAENEPLWIQWRADRLTDFLAKIYREVKNINPRLIVSMSPAVYPFSLNHLLQDVPRWIEMGIVDYLHPQIYRDRVESYRGEARKLRELLPLDTAVKVAPGIAFKANGRELTVEDIQKCLRINRELKFDGYLCFHYEGLRKNNVMLFSQYRCK